MVYNGPLPLGIPSGGSADTTFTAYSVVTAGTAATGAFQNVSGVGTVGQVLTSAGAAALPVWGGGGSLVLIQTQDASSSASLTFTTGITATYSNYILYFSKVVAATTNQQMELQWSSDGGSTYKATGYLSGLMYGGYNGTLTNNVNSTTYVYLTSGTNTTDPNAGVFNLMQINIARYPEATGTWNRADGLMSICGSVYQTALTVNAFKILMSSGNITSGTFTLFGVLE